MREAKGLIYGSSRYINIYLKSGSEYFFNGNNFTIRTTFLKGECHKWHKVEVFDGNRRVFDRYAKNILKIEEGIN